MARGWLPEERGLEGCAQAAVATYRAESHTASYSWVFPSRSTGAGPQSCHRWLSHASVHTLCVCVSPSAEVCTESQKAALLLSARNVRPGASTSTKVLQKQYNLCLRVNNANQSRLSGYRLPSHLSLVKHTLSLSVLTAPTWNLTLCIHVYMRCVAWLK